MNLIIFSFLIILFIKFLGVCELVSPLGACDLKSNGLLRLGEALLGVALLKCVTVWVLGSQKLKSVFSLLPLDQDGSFSSTMFDCTLPYFLP